MTSDTALKMASEGKRVRRSIWARNDYLFVDGDEHWMMFYGAVPFKYSLKPSDLNSTDWSIHD